MTIATKTDRERAIESARERRSIGYNEAGACQHALRAFPSVKLSVDQLKALAFGATLHGFGKPVSANSWEGPGGDAWIADGGTKD